MILPSHNDQCNLDALEKNPPFATYMWARPICPWCAQWLRPVDMRPIGLPFTVQLGCPYFHGLFVFSQGRWMDYRVPQIARGGDGAWWTTIDQTEIRARYNNFC